MKIAVLLKSGPGTVHAERALQTARDMQDAGHSVSLCLLQDAVRLCEQAQGAAESAKAVPLAGIGMDIHVLIRDAALRGVSVDVSGPPFSGASFESLVDVMTSCDRVVGIL